MKARDTVAKLTKFVYGFVDHSFIGVYTTVPGDFKRGKDTPTKLN